MALPADPTILVIGRHPSMMTKVLDFLRQNNFEAVGANSNEEALALFQEGNFDVVLIGGGVDTESRDLFHKEFSLQNTQVKILDVHPQTVLAELEKIKKA